MEAFSEFLSMGGHAAFIWPAYGVAVVVLFALVMVSLRTLKANEIAVREIEATRPRRPRRNAEANKDDP
jgi:heme exporter protein D